MSEHFDRVEASASENELKLGPIRFAKGVLHRHVLVGIYAGFTTISMVVYINLIQPSLLLNVLGIPFSDIGSATGRLGATHEIIAIVTMSVIGALSDQYGRRLIYSFGFFVIGVGYFIYPLADSLTQLLLFRGIFAIGSGTIMVMVTTIALDYSHETSRGKWLGIINTISGIGVMTMTLIMSRIPAQLESMGYDGPEIARYVFWIAAAICIVSALVLGVGLKKKSRDQSKKEDGPLAAVIQALKLGLEDRKVLLSYGAAFIGRGDLAIIGMFLPLWVTSSALEAGLPTAEATARAGTLLVVHQVAVIGWAFCGGYLIDQFNKVTVLAFAFVLASIGYGSLWIIEDPFSSLALVGIVILAAGEISIIMTNNAIAGERAPGESRGVVIGLLGVFGGIGIAFASFLGGEIFDSVSVTSPFVMMALFNLIIIAWAVLLKRAEKL